MAHPSPTWPLLACLFALWPWSPLAAGQKLEIVSDNLEMDDRSRVAIFSGHVQATDQEMKLFSERMTVRYHGEATGSGNKGVKDVKAEGNVVIRVGDREGKSDTALYKVGENLLELFSARGKAVIQQGEDRLEGKRILIHLSKDRRIERVSAQGGEGRVSARIMPGDPPREKTPPIKAPKEE